MTDGQPTPLMVTETIGALTKNGNKMLRMRSEDKRFVNAFGANGGKVDQLEWFVRAGYPEVAALGEGQKLGWTRSPIQVWVTPDGQWLKLEGVDPRPEGAISDPVWTPDLAWYRRYAAKIARITLESAVFFDTETTGKQHGAEIISLAWLTPYTGQQTAHEVLIRPSRIEDVALTTPVTGLKPEDVASALTFDERYDHISFILSDLAWCAYNIAFDAQRIEEACMMAGKEPIIAPERVDAMILYSWWSGLWDTERQDWKYVKLSEAIEQCGLDQKEAHDAGNDVEMMVALVRHIASHPQMPEAPKQPNW